MNTYEKPPGGWGVTGATARPYEGPEEESFGEPSFQTICRSIPSHNSASPSDSLWRRNKRRSFSRVISSERVLKEPLARRISSSIPVMRSRSPAVAGLFLSATRAARGERASSYKLIATACPKFTDRCSSRVGMRIRKSQWLRSSFERSELFRTEQERDIARSEALANRSRAILQATDGVTQCAASHGSGSDNQRAISDGLRNVLEFLRVRKQRRGTDRGTCLTKGRIVGVHDAQMQETEVAHGASGRANVERVACGHQHDAQTVEFSVSRQGPPFYRRRGGAECPHRLILVCVVSGHRQECLCYQRFRTDRGGGPSES